MTQSCHAQDVAKYYLTTFLNMNLESIGEYDMQSQILVLDKNQTGNKQVIKRYPLQHDRGDTLIGMCFCWKEKFSRHINSTYQSPDWKTMSERQHLWFQEEPLVHRTVHSDFGTPSESLFSWSVVNTQTKKIAALFLPAIKHLKWKTAQSLMWLLVPFYYQLYTIIFYLCGCQISTVMQWINLPSKFNPFADTWGKCTFNFFKQVLWIDGMIVQVPKTI